MKTKPFGMVYDYFCSSGNVPVAEEYIGIIQQYEKTVLKKR